MLDERRNDYDERFNVNDIRANDLEVASPATVSRVGVIYMSLIVWLGHVQSGYIGYNKNPMIQV